MNTAQWSKINWTAIAVLAVGIAIQLELIPYGWQEIAITAATLLAPIAIIVFRTWFTAPKV